MMYGHYHKEGIFYQGFVLEKGATPEKDVAPKLVY
jgi:hypothetical protein